MREINRTESGTLTKIDISESDFEYIVATEPAFMCGTLAIVGFTNDKQDAEKIAKKEDGVVWVLKIVKRIDNSEAFISRLKEEIKER